MRSQHVAGMLNNQQTATTSPFPSKPITFPKAHSPPPPPPPPPQPPPTPILSTPLDSLQLRTEWRQRLDIGTEEDNIHQLDRAAQVTIFRLRTGHCQLHSYLHRLNISHSDQCPCGTGPQIPSHILQSSQTFDAFRRQTWPSLVDAHRKLWGPVETLRQTVDFALLPGLKI